MNGGHEIVKPGELVGGKYRVERVIGVGGMGVVVAASHIALGQLVAIKFLQPESGKDPEARARFLREARAAGGLRSEHAVEVKDVAALPDGTPYIVMEHLVGTDLAHALRARGALHVGEGVDYVLQACLGLAEAHRLGIVHRDIKPANMFLTRRPDGSPLVKLLDFGISKMTHGEGSGVTRTAVVMGSAEYMSPEQIRSARSTDARSDVWSLGVVLFELLTGRLPFNGESFIDVCVAVAHESAPPLGIAGVDAVVRRCLEKEPAQRYASVADLAAALAPFGSAGASAVAANIRRTLVGRDEALRLPLPATPVAAETNESSTLQKASAQSVTRPHHRGQLQLLAVGLTAAALVAALVVTVRRPLPGEGDAAPASAAVLPPASAPVVSPMPPAPAVIDAGIVSTATAPPAPPAPAPPPARSHPSRHGERRPKPAQPKPPSDIVDPYDVYR
jgi:serine/threonine-protein kinase